MNSLLSTYFDLTRVFAAILVLYSHSSFWGVSDGILFQTFGGKEVGHSAVIIFFVLSGFLISLSAHRPYNNLKSFTISRFARLYSVIIPALFFTWFTAFIVTEINPSASQYIYGVENQQWIRYLLSIPLLNQIWNFSVNIGMNGPFWSLAYEGWFYVILAAWVFSKNIKMFVIISVLIFIIIGPKIWLLLPCWLVGVFLERYMTQKMSYNISKPILFLGIFITSITSLFLIINPKVLPFYSGDYSQSPWFYSIDIFPDFILSLFIALNFFFIGNLGKQLSNKNKNKIQSIIKWHADRSYTLYLFHAPILFTIANLFSYDKSSIYYTILLLVITYVISMFISNITEQKAPLLRNILENKFIIGKGV